MKPKKRNRFIRIELFETSAVGTPSYPDAIAKSFAKQVSEAYNSVERRVNKEVMTEENVENANIVVEQQEITTENTETTETEEVKEEPQEEQTQEEETIETEEVKSFSMKDVETIVEKRLKEALSNLSVERGLVEERKSAEELVKGASTGELFLAMLNK